MDEYVGFDVSKEETSFCVMDAAQAWSVAVPAASSWQSCSHKQKCLDGRSTSLKAWTFGIGMGKGDETTETIAVDV